MAKSRRERTIKLVQPPTGGGVGVFSVEVGEKVTFYAFREVSCDIGGRGFAVHRLGLGPLYHVRVGSVHECSCECLGFLRHGRCKHIVALLSLLGDGAIANVSTRL